MRRLLLILLTILPVVAAAAESEEKTYQVEVIVFQNVGVNSDEQALIAAPPPLPSDAVEPQDAAPVGLQLANAGDALARNGNYRILTQHVWVQSLDAKEKELPVHLHSDDGSLDGDVHFYMSRFLHFDTDLRYTDITDPAHPVYRIHESRRIKSGETNYFDHPRFGLLVRLTPVPTATAKGTNKGK